MINSCGQLRERDTEMSDFSRKMRKEFKRNDDIRDYGLSTPIDIIRYDNIPYGNDPEWNVLDVYRPESAGNKDLPVIVSVHGGGWIYGDKNRYQFYCMSLAQKGFTVVNLNYRLAPEHPYPAASEDATAVWNYLVENVAQADHILLAGDSAGGNMALCLTQRLISEGKPAPRELLLFSPWTDMTGTSESYETNQDIDPILTKEFVMDSAKAYMGENDPLDPAFSPLFGSFENFPPVYIMAGRNGILLDDSVKLKEKIDQAGGKAELDIEEKGWHVYQQMPGSMAKKAMKRLAEHVSDEIYGKR